MNEPPPPDRARLDAHLDALLDLEPAARAERIAALRATDAALADELARLLHLGERARAAHFLTGSAAAPNERTGANDAAADGGRRLGAYRLESPLGEGGSGTVWRARRDDGRFDGRVAIKLLHTTLAGSGAAARFALEGSILARLVHPHIARLMDAGVADDGQPYLVLELVDGERIDHHCDARQLTLPARIRLFAQVLDAVGFAHRHLVIHRDIKPANVLVDERGEARLLDFGIAKLLDDGTMAGTDSPLTVDAGRWFTPAYAAPEQRRGDAVSTLTDVYALGLLLFELLAGTLPARRRGDDGEHGEAREPLAAAFARAARADAAWAARAVDARGGDRAGIKRTLAGELGSILDCALAEDPAARYRSVDAFAEDLRRLLANEPVLARRASLGYRLAKFARRNRALVASAALLLLAIGGGVLGTWSQARRAEANAVTALRERDRARAELARADATNELIGFLLAEGGERPLTAPQLLGHAETMVARQFHAEPRLRASLEATVAQQFLNLEATARADAAIARALAAARGVGDPVLQAELRCRQAAIRTQRGEYDDARKAIDDALAWLARAPDAPPIVRAECIASRAKVQLDSGDPQLALADARQAVALLPAPAPGQRQAAISHRGILADVQARLGDYPGAIASYEQSMAALRGLGRERTSVAATTLNNLAVVLLDAGQVARGERVLQESRAVTRQVTGGAGINPVADTNLAGAWVALGRARAAADLLEAALVVAARERLSGFIAVKAAAAWCAAGEATRCAQRLDSGAAALRTFLPPGHSAFGTVALTRARLAALRGDAAGERRHLEAALEHYERASEVNPMAFEAREALARALARNGDAERARVLADRAVADARRYTRGVAASEWLGSALLAQADVAARRGDRAAATASARESLAHLDASVGADAPGAVTARTLLAGLQASSARAVASPSVSSTRSR